MYYIIYYIIYYIYMLVCVRLTYMSFRCLVYKQFHWAYMPLHLYKRLRFDMSPRSPVAS
jgi:hypothetical protein